MPNSLSDVRQEAKHAFKYWGVFLEVQRRRVLKHVTEAAIAEAGYLPASVGTVLESDELRVLRSIGMPLPADLSAYWLPVRISVAASGRVSFWAGVVPDIADSVVLNLIRTLPAGELERAELMRAAPEDGWYLRQAAETLNAALDIYGIDLVFNAAKLWSSFHAGAVLMPFVAVTPDILSVQPVSITSIVVTEGREEEEDFRMVIDAFQGEGDW